MRNSEEIVSGGKIKKDRFTALIGANMAGTELLPLMVIGTHAKPRCFKKNPPPVRYASNKSAWMTGTYLNIIL